ncbi:MAG: hypothetical protein LW817_05610 [Candidatus Caenarcaniphilales bacterium]|jgi:hypothetical protein|nr:hypothetical protein [Candidatus Caenarcaniphilales bacterium]
MGNHIGSNSNLTAEQIAKLKQERSQVLDQKQNQDFKSKVSGLRDEIDINQTAAPSEQLTYREKHIESQISILETEEKKPKSPVEKLAYKMEDNASRHEALADKHSKTLAGSDEPRHKVAAHIMGHASKFWNGEANFWQKLQEQKIPDKNQVEVKKLSLQLATKEMQYSSFTDIDFGDRKALATSKEARSSIKSEIEDIKSQIGSLAGS